MLGQYRGPRASMEPPYIADKSIFDATIDFASAPAWVIQQGS